MPIGPWKIKTNRKSKKDVILSPRDLLYSIIRDFIKSNLDNHFTRTGKSMVFNENAGPIVKHLEILGYSNFSQSESFSRSFCVTGPVNEITVFKGLQRIGRSGHSISELTLGRFVVFTLDSAFAHIVDRVLNHAS